jgi:hypothetical protein
MDIQRIQHIINVYKEGNINEEAWLNKQLKKGYESGY